MQMRMSTIAQAEDAPMDVYCMAEHHVSRIVGPPKHLKVGGSSLFVPGVKVSIAGDGK